MPSPNGNGHNGKGNHLLLTCPVCGLKDSVEHFEDHHVEGRKNSDETELICAGCQRKIHRWFPDVVRVRREPYPLPLLEWLEDRKWDLFGSEFAQIRIVVGLKRLVSVMERNLTIESSLELLKNPSVDPDLLLFLLEPNHCALDVVKALDLDKRNA